ncbi:aldehyde dehydrogenase family protein [Paraburkholderia silviterrae]|uniref:Salicylaldehyde dehydrogenase n=1 Tax=Paraburkholderia silviterrae TaxID=2528715 RepID=A0A4R5LZU3_9BURK|nr:aldehyde dehydrogenase family protein [Paraburkholderia silviterrae]TDG17964.1 aldehyde dehydrogenase family protein [Paraburkholderia silviterrae]
MNDKTTPRDLVREGKLFIDGEWVAGADGKTLPDYNPATGELFATIHQAARSDAQRAVDAAHRVKDEWADMLVSKRAEILLASADALAAMVDDVRDVLIEESGSTVPKAMFEVMSGIDLLRSAAGDARHIFGETLPHSAQGQFGFTIRRPLGVIAGIAPFNAPFWLAMKKVVLALAAGNTFVLKPSEETPMTGLKIAELFERGGLPAGVLNVVPGPADVVGDVLMRDPRVRMLTFTGSTRVGRQLAVEAARQMKKVTLEMGGKNPLIVLRDADLDYAVRAACFGIFFHQGQVCMANSRIIVEAPVYDAFAETFVARAKTYKVGDPRDPATVVGPLIRRTQCGVIDGHVQDAVDKGARLLLGGTHHENFYAPTILADVTPQMRIYEEESFGPVTSLIRVADAEEALRVANDTAYGLSSGIITNDLQKAFSLAMRIEAGMVHINDTTVTDEPHVPFGGTKMSGMGREGGRYSMEEMTELKWITVQMGQRQFPF